MLGLVVTLAGVVGVWRVPGVYTAQVRFVALPPLDPAPRNTLQDTTASLSPFASMVAAQASEGSIEVGIGTSATLYGAGFRDGYKVTVPNTGGQWNVSHDRPVISVEVVGPSQESVERTLATLVGRVQDEAARMQADRGVADYAPSRSIRRRPNPSSSTWPGGGSTPRSRRWRSVPSCRSRQPPAMAAGVSGAGAWPRRRTSTAAGRSTPSLPSRHRGIARRS